MVMNSSFGLWTSNNFNSAPSPIGSISPHVKSFTCEINFMKLLIDNRHRFFTHLDFRQYGNNCGDYTFFCVYLCSKYPIISQIFVEVENISMRAVRDTRTSLHF
jgi:hypothetical protein